MHPSIFLDAKIIKSISYRHFYHQKCLLRRNFALTITIVIMTKEEIEVLKIEHSQSGKMLLYSDPNFLTIKQLLFSTKNAEGTKPPSP